MEATAVAMNEACAYAYLTISLFLHSVKLLPGGQIDSTEVEGTFEVMILDTSFFVLTISTRVKKMRRSWSNRETLACRTLRRVRFR